MLLLYMEMEKFKMAALGFASLVLVWVLAVRDHAYKKGTWMYIALN